MSFTTAIFDTAPRRSHTRCGAEALVIGEGHRAGEIVRRLVELGARTHCLASTVEEHAAVEAKGAIPHRAEDIPGLMAHLDILVSTGLPNYVSARLIARLPARALIVDFAPPPGSVDFESARKLDRAVIWVRNARNQDDAWREIHARIAAMEAEGIVPS